MLALALLGAVVKDVLAGKSNTDAALSGVVLVGVIVTGDIEIRRHRR